MSKPMLVLPSLWAAYSLLLITSMCLTPDPRDDLQRLHELVDAVLLEPGVRLRPGRHLPGQLDLLGSAPSLLSPAKELNIIYII